MRPVGVLCCGALLASCAPDPSAYREPDREAAICAGMEAFAAADAPADSCLHVRWSPVPESVAVTCAIEGAPDAAFQAGICRPMFEGGLTIYARNHIAEAQACGTGQRAAVLERNADGPAQTGRADVVFADRPMVLSWSVGAVEELSLRSADAPEGCGFP